MARGATANAEASASGKGARIHKHLVPGIAPVLVQMIDTGTSSPSVPLWDVSGAQRRHCGGVAPTTCKDYEGRPMKAPPEAYGGA